jgi:hypothetical protein
VVRDKGKKPSCFNWRGERVQKRERVCMRQRERERERERRERQRIGKKKSV